MTNAPLDPETAAEIDSLRETAMSLQAQVTSRYLKGHIAYAIRDLDEAKLWDVVEIQSAAIKLAAGRIAFVEKIVSERGADAHVVPDDLI